MPVRATMRFNFFDLVEGAIRIPSRSSPQDLAYRSSVTDQVIAFFPGPSTLKGFGGPPIDQLRVIGYEATVRALPAQPLFCLFAI